MAKRKFVVPYVVLSHVDPGGSGSQEGGGSAQSTTDPFPCTFQDWLKLFGVDNTGDEEITLDDYGIWWLEQKFTLDQWKEAGNSEDDWDYDNWSDYLG